MKTYKYILFFLFLISKSASACNVTLNPGLNVVSSAVSSASSGDTICLNNGTYSETTTIQLKQNQTLKGLGSNKTDAVIYSTSDPIINSAPGATVFNFKIIGDPSNLPFIGVHVENAPNSTVWSLLITWTTWAIQMRSSDGSNLWDIYTEYNGDPLNGNADGDVFIHNSDDVEILYGSLVGKNDGPFGDGGSIACFGSSGLLIDGTYFTHSGNSSIYFVDCDNSTVQNTTIYGSNEWGLDIVSGTTAGHAGYPLYLDGTANFTAIGNTITNSYFGASVFDEAGNGSGTYTNNIFNSNNQSSTRSCQGINVIGSTGNVTLSGNTASPSPVICSY
jgi:hypothetical protein